MADELKRRGELANEAVQEVNVESAENAAAEEVKAIEALEEKWRKELGKLVRDNFCMDGSGYMRDVIIGHLLKGLRFDYSLPVNCRQDKNNPDKFSYSVYTKLDKETYMGVFTNDDYCEDAAGYIRLRSILCDVYENDFDGIVIDPGQGDFKVSCGVLYPLMELIQNLIVGEEEFEVPEEPEEKYMTCDMTAPRPMDETVFNSLCDALNVMPADGSVYFKLNFKNYVGGDKIEYIKTCRNGETYYVEIAYDMADFNWDEPLILAGDSVPRDVFEEIFEVICSGGRSEDISYISNHFKKI